MTDVNPEHDNTTPERTVPAKPVDLEPSTTADDNREDEPLYDLVEVPAAETSAVEPFATSELLPEVVAASAEQPLAEPLRTTAVAAWEAAPGVPPAVENPAAPMQTIYVPSPTAPQLKGNRGIGILIAAGSAIVFAALYSLALAIILSVNGAGIRFDFLLSFTFYIPVIFFLVGFIALVALVNRGSWWAYVLGSLFVGLFVYFGTIATGLALSNVFLETPAGAAQLFAIALSNPFVIAAGLLGREVSMWMGAAISARGRRVKAKNTESRAEFDRESAERHAQYEQSRYRAPRTAV